MIIVNLNGVQDSINTTIGRVNARAGQPTDFKDGIFIIAVDMVALMYSACEMLLSIAVDVRAIRESKEPAPAAE